MKTQRNIINGGRRKSDTETVQYWTSTCSKEMGRDADGTFLQTTYECDPQQNNVSKNTNSNGNNQPSK